MEVFGIVYLIWNKVNGKRYVGQTVQPLKNRFNAHARNKKFLIGKVIQKYGKENFRYGVIKYCASKEEMDYWEKYFIVALKSKVPYGYNMTDGGEGIIGCTDETRAKRIAKLKGISKSPEHCAHLSIAKTGKSLPAETCTRMAEAQSGEKNHNYGKPCAPEVSSKISIKNRGKSLFQNLIAELNANNLSYHGLAKILGLSYQAVSAKMLGRLNFTAKDIAKLVEYFNKPTEYLLKQEDCAEPVKAKREDSPYKNLLNELAMHDISYRQLAELLGVSHSSAAIKMRGKRNFTIKDKEKLVEIFGKPIEYLLERSED